MPEPNAHTINDMLKYIGITEISSYDFLEKAESAKTASAYMIDSYEDASIDAEVLSQIAAIPPDVLKDAEKMLRYIDNKD